MGGKGGTRPWLWCRKSVFATMDMPESAVFMDGCVHSCRVPLIFGVAVSPPCARPPNGSDQVCTATHGIHKKHAGVVCAGVMCRGDMCGGIARIACQVLVRVICLGLIFV